MTADIEKGGSSARGAALFLSGDAVRAAPGALHHTRGQRMREINEQVRGLFETEQDQMNEEIAAILTPVQMEIFNNRIVRMRGARGRRGRGGARGPTGPGGPGFRGQPREERSR